MGEPSPALERLSEAKIFIFVPQSMKDELEARAEQARGEPMSMSKLVRQAIREYFKRHPMSEAPR